MVPKMKRFLEDQSRRKREGWAEPGQALASVERARPWSLRQPRKAVLQMSLGSGNLTGKQRNRQHGRREKIVDVGGTLGL